MKKFINRNYFWANLFVEQINSFGINHVCISPGSRNTPLTLAFANNKKFKKYIHIDERSSGFFALGIAKIIKKPVVLVTTSGTAVAELYPAIIEAYNQRIPLVICTADRPNYLRNTGANQTINQNNIYKNHIRYFRDFGLPSLNEKKLKLFVNNIIDGILIADENNPGPMHFNFPFKKPLEPETFSDDINFQTSDFLQSDKKIRTKNISFQYEKKSILKKVQKSKKGLIFCSWDNFDPKFYNELIQFSKLNNFPILTDGSSDLRFSKLDNENIIVNHSSFLNNLADDADLILQFGNAPTSKSMIDFINKTRAEKIIINQFGDLKDSSRKKPKVIKLYPLEFLKIANSDNLNPKDCKIWKDKILTIENDVEKYKNTFLHNLPINIEPSWPNQLLNSIPQKSNLFISNSLPIRDFDYFASKKKNNLNIFTNRGASGIDGIISTASGIASQSKNKTFLVIGDLAFYHNLTALSTLSELKIPLIIILINNNGGGIFKMLPVADTKKHFVEYFNTPHNLDFSKIVKSFGGNYSNPKSWKIFNKNIEHAKSINNYSVIEIKTDTGKSHEVRKMYLAKIKELTALK